MKLILYQLGVLLFFDMLFGQFCSDSVVVLLHLLFLDIVPLTVDLFLESSLAVFGIDLDRLLGLDVAEEHLRVESLDLVLVIVEHFVGTVDLSLTLRYSERFFHSINLSS